MVVVLMSGKLIVIMLLLLFCVGTAHAELTDDLISYYKFDETSGTTFGDSFGSNDGTGSNSAISGGDGIINAGADFTGGDYTLTTNYQPDFSNPFTFSYWVKRNGDPASNETLLSNINGESNANGFRSRLMTNGTIQITKGSKSGGTILGSSTTTVTDNEWHFITIQYTGTLVKLFINGEEELSVTNSFNNISRNLVFSENWVSGASVYGNYYIDEMGIWDRAITTDEIEELYNSGSGLTYPFGFKKYSIFDDCVAFYDFKKDAKDVVGDNNGTVVSATLTTNHLGQTDSAYDFDGTDDKITLGNIGNIKSVGFWIYLDSSSEEIFEGDPNAHLIYSSSGTLTYPAWDNAYVDGVDTDNISASSWHFVVITSSTDVNCTAIQLGINDSSYGSFDMSNIFLFSSELSNNEIIQLYDLTKNKVIYPVVRGGRK